MGSELLPVHDDDDISQDIPASEAVEVEEDVAGVAGELDAAVCRRGHLESVRHNHHRKMRRENSQTNTLNTGKRRLLLWDMLGCPIAPGRGSPSSLVPRQTVLHHTKLLPGCLVRSLGRQRDLARLIPPIKLVGEGNQTLLRISQPSPLSPCLTHGSPTPVYSAHSGTSPQCFQHSY